MAYRVALLGIYHESNTFIRQNTTLEDFKRGHWLEGTDIVREYQSAYHEIGGMIEAMKAHDVELLPVMYAEATPGGIITKEAFETLTGTMFQKLQELLPVDGCLVVPHGAGVSEMFPDMDGHWLSVLRQMLGDAVPITGTLDPHANVSEAMIRATDALVAYKTNPHIDQREAGKEAATLLVRAMQKEIRPVQYFQQLPMAISIEQQYTSREPCLSLYDYAAGLSRKKEILSTSIILGFPYADVSEMGSSFIVVSDGRQEQAVLGCDGLLALVNDNLESFVGSKLSISSQLPLIEACDKPVLLLDMGDNIGGGSSGTSTFLLHALEDHNQYRTFICICDPAAVLKCEQLQKGEQLTLSFGHRYEDEGEPFTAMVTLVDRVEGVFSEDNPRHGGQVNFDMGLTAILQTGKGTTVMLTSRRTPPFSLRQLTAFGIVPGDFDVIVAKGVNAPIAAYAPVCKTTIQVDTPGVTRADMTMFDYKNRRKPLFPFER